MFNLNTIQETTKYFADQFATYAVAKDVKEYTKKSQDFTVSLIDIIFYRESRSTDPLFDLFNKLIPLKLD